MKHEKIDDFPYGMTEEEAKLLMSLEDVYDVLETFDDLEDSLDFIKETYGIKAYEYAKKDAEQSVYEEKAFIKYMYNNGDINYMGYTTFDISNGVNECSFVWFSSGKIARVEFY